MDWVGAVLVCTAQLFRPPEAVESPGEPEADHGVRNRNAGEKEDAEAGKQDERGVEASSGADEKAAGESFKQEREPEDRKPKRDARGSGERAGPGRAEEHGELHAGGHRPIEQWSFFKVADAVGVKRDVIVTEEHLASNFDVDGVSVVQQRRREEGEARIEGEPQQQDAEERGARS